MGVCRGPLSDCYRLNETQRDYLDDGAWPNGGELVQSALLDFPSHRFHPFFWLIWQIWMQQIRRWVNLCRPLVRISSLRRMKIPSGEAHIKAPHTYNLQFEARARDNIPDTRDDGPAEGYIIQEMAIIETSWLDLGALICTSREGINSWRWITISFFDYCDIHEVMWNSITSKVLTFDDKTTRAAIESRYAATFNWGHVIPGTIPTCIQRLNQAAVWQRLKLQISYEGILPQTPSWMRSWLRLGNPQLNN